MSNTETRLYVGDPVYPPKDVSPSGLHKDELARTSYSLKLHGSLLGFLGLVQIVAYLFRNAALVSVTELTVMQALLIVCFLVFYLSLHMVLLKDLVPKYRMPLLCAFVLLHSFFVGVCASMDKTRIIMWVLMCLNVLVALLTANRHFKVIDMEVSSGYLQAVHVVSLWAMTECFCFMLGLPTVSAVIGATVLIGGFIMSAVAYHEANDNVEHLAKGIIALISEVTQAPLALGWFVAAYLAATT